MKYDSATDQNQSKREENEDNWEELINTREHNKRR